MTLFDHFTTELSLDLQKKTGGSKRRSSCLAWCALVNLLLSPWLSSGFVIGRSTYHKSIETQNTKKSLDHLLQLSMAKVTGNGQDFRNIYRRMKTICRAQPSNSKNGKDDGGDNSSDSTTIPKHIAFICDGNSRWAKARFLPTSAGHAAGADRLIDTLQSLKQAGITYCTFYGFSTENWKRPPEEIREIFFVMERTARQFYNKALQEKVRVKILGDIDDKRISIELRDSLYNLERDTAAIPDSKLTVCIAVNYGGRRDIVNAAKKLSEIPLSKLQDSDSWDDDSEELFSSMLCTHGVPDPEMIIRTGGERRLSNFLLWNSAYSELYFADDLWPDFDESCLDLALQWYSNRCRRFGGRKDSSNVATSNPPANGFITKH